jgi:hypothetical protein
LPAGYGLSDMAEKIAGQRARDQIEPGAKITQIGAPVGSADLACTAVQIGGSIRTPPDES